MPASSFIATLTRRFQASYWCSTWFLPWCVPWISKWYMLFLFSKPPPEPWCVSIRVLGGSRGGIIDNYEGCRLPTPRGEENMKKARSSRHRPSPDGRRPRSRARSKGRKRRSRPEFGHCPVCKEGVLQIKRNRSTCEYFLGCSRHKTKRRCGYTTSFEWWRKMRSKTSQNWVGHASH